MVDNINEELDQTSAGEEAVTGENRDQTEGEKRVFRPSPINIKKILLLTLSIWTFAVIAGSFHAVTNPAQPGSVSAPTSIDEILGEGIDKNELIQTEKYLSGTLENITVNPDGTGVLTVNANLVDLDSVSDFIPEDEITIAKTSLSLRFDSDTVFENKSAQSLKAGDLLQINTNESVYLSTDLVAEKVITYDRQAEMMTKILGETNSLYGTVKEVSEETLVVAAEVVDKELLETMDLTGSYVVPYTTKDYTLIVGQNTNVFGIEAGSLVTVVTDGDIYETEALTATSVEPVVFEEDNF